MTGQEKRAITDEVRESIRKTAEIVVNHANIDESKRQEALEATVKQFEIWYQEGHDVVPAKPIEPMHVPTLEWVDGVWKIGTDWLDKDWIGSEPFLFRKK